MMQRLKRPDLLTLPPLSVTPTATHAAACRFIFAFVMVTLLGLVVAAALKSALHWTRPFW
jgi:hypothetical protein